MRLSGFTVIRNAEIMGYPVVASIRSILPLVDEMVVGVGQSDDNTESLIRSIGDPKIRIFNSHWDTTKQDGGLILSEKTNEAMNQCANDWCFYLQADEVVHEQDYLAIRSAFGAHEHDRAVEGLLFQYVHFYGSYSVVGTARNWYRNEVRMVRKNSGIRSVGDAQGFRVGNRPPRVRAAGAHIYHYGWVKPPKKMGEKNTHMNRWWHGRRFDGAFDDFKYTSSYGLKPFAGSHPAVMNDLVAAQDWTFSPRSDRSEWRAKDYKNLASDFIESFLHMRLGENRNYELLK